MLSTHWRRPHRPSERELGILDVLARQVADMIERQQAERTIRQNQAWPAGQQQALGPR